MECRERPFRRRLLASISAGFALAVLLLAALVPICCADEAARNPAVPLLQAYCFDCHGRDEPEANISLERMADDPTFADGFRDWRRAYHMLQQHKMPPTDADQPTAAEREQLMTLIQNGVRKMARDHAGDPGEIVIRRLTSAEYGYTIEDLTGLDLDLDRDFVSDAVGGEGFTNVGNVQFLQDSTLERYLAAAKTVASHAVLGAGKLEFYRHPGEVGRELFSLGKIQEIYQGHGFRGKGGEGAPPYGMECFPKSFYAAWRYTHRNELGVPNVSLADLAAQEQIEPRFLEHIWSTLNDQGQQHPVREIVEEWRDLPAPNDIEGDVEPTIRRGCDDVVEFMQFWQELLSQNSVERETGAVFTDEPLEIEEHQRFTARFSARKQNRTVTYRLSVLAVNPDAERAVVVWREPKMFFETLEGVQPPAAPLRSFLSQPEIEHLRFGQNPGGVEIGPDDFVIPVGETRTFKVTSTQDNSLSMDLIVETTLDSIRGQDSVVRVDISSGRTPRRQRAYSALLGDKNWSGLAELREQALRFAQALPEISHREPAPADRDPIPILYSNLWNNSERAHFHATAKYYRKDRFFVEHILDEAARPELDDDWTSLLTSFDYHDLHLQFAANKFQIDLQGRTIEDIEPRQIDRFPDSIREFIQNLSEEYQAMQGRLRAARTRHLQDALDFAARAWRRPLQEEEQRRLTAFYDSQLREFDDDHPRAFRALLTRILVSPEFLYRGEEPSTEGILNLTDWELASRLSYFLWSSVPDDELCRAAASGKLREVAELEQQTARMLRDPKSRRFATEFFGQWLGFYQFDRSRKVDAERFPEFNDRVQRALYDESITFFEHLVRDDRPVGDILFADYAFLNKTLANHYGISADVSDETLSKVDNVAGWHRGGLFGMGAVLVATSNPLRTSPVKRGEWILRRVLGTPVPPPPANVGSIPADDVLGDGLTVRQRLEAHRSNPACMSCHSRIDPLGFSLEHYDTLGRWRDEYRDGRPIDDSGTLSDGASVSGPSGLREYLKTQQAQFQRTLCTKLVGYAFGRSESLADQQLIDDMLSGLADDPRFSNLVMTVIRSPQFRQRRAAQPSLVDAARTTPARGE